MFILIQLPDMHEAGRVKIKINLNFYFHTCLWCLKVLHKTFWGTTKKCENRNLSLFILPGSGREGWSFIMKVTTFAVQICPSKSCCQYQRNRKGLCSTDQTQAAFFSG